MITSKIQNGRQGAPKWPRKEKIMSFLVATNIVASRPSDHRPTGMPHALANNYEIKKYHILPVLVTWWLSGMVKQLSIKPVVQKDFLSKLYQSILESVVIHP